MDKLYHFIIFCFTICCFATCNDDEPESNGIGSKDHFISAFALSVDGITYQASITGDKITVEIPYNASLEGATVEYVLCEGASINPKPSTIQNWENEWKFVVTSKTRESKVYSYTYQYADIEQSGNVILSTQAEVDHFGRIGINKINGSLTIGTVDGEEITSLNGLANLKRISNSLIINPSYKGSDLSGLDNLEQLGSLKLGSTISTSKNTTLKTVNLPSLSDVAGDFVINCSVVEKISIPKVETIGEDAYVVSDALLDLNANAVSTIGSSLIVKGSVVGNGAGTASTEAIVFASLKSVGNELAFQYFPKLQGIYLPALENVIGPVSFTNLSSIGSIAMTNLYSTGDLTISDCNNLSTIELPNLVSSGAFNIQASQLNKLNTPSLTNISGDMYFRNVLLHELDLSQIEFNGNTLSLNGCQQLNKIIGAKTFNGSLKLFNSGRTLTEFTIEGIANIQGDFECSSYNNIENFTMPFVSIAGDVTINLSTSTGNIKTIQFLKLQEIGGSFKLENNYKAEKIEFPVLKKIGGSCSISTQQVTTGVFLNTLESIGFNDTKAKASFSILSGNITCPNLKAIAGDFDITINETSTTSMSYPNLETISNNLTINSRKNQQLKSVDFSNLKAVKNIKIMNLSGLKDFTTFRHLFEIGVITDISQWLVSGCFYNPTYQNMKEGQCVPVE